jgi:hypothetical protein
MAHINLSARRRLRPGKWHRGARRGLAGAVAFRCDHRAPGQAVSRSPSPRAETCNDTEAINRHREMTPSERVALAIEASRAALLFAKLDELQGHR